MKPSEIRFLHLSNLLTTLTGLALYGFKKLASPADAYSNVSGQKELLAHNLHILVGPLLVFALGIIWSCHIWPRFQELSLPKMGVLKGLSGLLLMGMMFPMVLTAGLIQVTADEQWRGIWSQIHIASSMIWALFSILHLLQGGIRKKIRRRIRSS